MMQTGWQHQNMAKNNQLPKSSTKANTEKAGYPLQSTLPETMAQDDDDLSAKYNSYINISLKEKKKFSILLI